MRSFVHDLLHGWRLLAGRPAFAGLTVLILALGIGANAAIFSIVKGVLLEPLGFPDPERLVLLDENHLARGLSRFGVSPANLEDWQVRTESFTHVSGFVQRAGNLLAEGRATRVSYALVSANLFPLFGVATELGRGFEVDEEQPGRETVVVISYRFWQSHFGGRPDVVGQTLWLEDERHQVVGVMPSGFAFPAATTELWKPIALTPIEADDRTGRWLSAIGRLRSGATLEDAQSEMQLLAQQLAKAYPEADEGWSVTLTPLRTAVVAGAQAPLFMLWVATGLVLLIACANVAHLLLVRAAGRRHELAVRTALGAPRLRLVRQLLTENLLLSLLGGAAGLLVAWVGVRWLPSLADGSLPRAQGVAIDAGVMGFTLVLALGTGLLFGLMPALRISRDTLAPVLKKSGRWATGGGLRGALVACEVALAVMVLIGAGLLTRSFFKVLEVDPGFDPTHLLSLRVEPPMRLNLDGLEMAAAIDQVMAQRQQAAARYERVLEGIAALPAVINAAAVNHGPLAGDSWFFHFAVAGRDPPVDGVLPSGLARVVTVDYFETLKIPRVSGRSLTRQDGPEAPRAVVIDREMARLYWGSEDPIGQKITMGDVPPEFADRFTFTVVGVVGSVRHNTLETSARPTAYFPFAQATTGHYGDWGMTLVVRTAAEPLAIAETIRAEVERLEPTLPVFAVRSMHQVVTASLAGRRFHLQLLGGFAALALILAAVGIYGVIAYSVSQRTREIGIRLALGASGSDVLQQVVREGMKPVAAGLVIGLAGALGWTRALSGLLFGVPTADAPSFLAAAAILAGVAWVACLVPARWATRVEPIRALHDE